MLEDNMSNPNALPCVPFRFNILPQKSLTIVRFRQHTHIQKLSYDFDTLDNKVAYAWTAQVPWSIFFRLCRVWPTSCLCIRMTEPYMNHCNHYYISTLFFFFKLLTCAAASFSRLSHFFYVCLLAQIVRRSNASTLGFCPWWVIPDNCTFHTGYTHSKIVLWLWHSWQ